MCKPACGQPRPITPLGGPWERVGSQPRIQSCDSRHPALPRRLASKLETHEARVPKKPSSSDHFHRDIIVIGASAGGVQALLTITGQLPVIDAAIFIVLHSAPHRASLLPALLRRHVQGMQVVRGEDGLAVEPGHVYVSVPDYHLVLEPGHVRLVRGPMENRHRPSIDALFRSAAKAYGRRVIGVVLSGYLDDGSAGLHSIKRAGGLAVVQDPQDAIVPSMPKNAIATTAIDYIRPVTQIPGLLGELVKQRVQKEPDQELPRGEEPRNELVDPKGIPSAYTCPACNGTLWEIREGKLLRYACRVGHSYSLESMFDEQSEATERAMWAALRALEERADLTRRMEHRSRAGGLLSMASNYRELAESADNDAAVLRKMLLENPPMQTRERGDELEKTA
jgi:two-component system, chemotaxis family, protein-glutamate methylesterase/glutaminase